MKWLEMVRRHKPSPYITAVYSVRLPCYMLFNFRKVVTYRSNKEIFVLVRNSVVRKFFNKTVIKQLLVLSLLHI